MNLMKLAALTEDYIRYRRTLGERFVNNAFILQAFARSVGADATVDEVRTEQIAAFIGGTDALTTTWRTKYTTINGFFHFAKSRDHITHSPMPDKIAKRVPSFVPYIYSHEELHQLLETVRCYQRGVSSFDAHTFRTILLLLYGTGLRAGEIVRLNSEDVDFNESLLVIRLTKFHKSRLVPFGPQLHQALTEYVGKRTRPISVSGEVLPFFTTREGTRIVLNTLQAHFRRLREKSGIRRSDGASYQPRLHDLRHTFAVHRLTSWYQQGMDVQKLVYQLSVYLGHAHLEDTQIYLSMTPDLLQEANARFECYSKTDHTGGQP